MTGVAGSVHRPSISVRSGQLDRWRDRKGDLVIPSQPQAEYDRTPSDQSGADADQTPIDGGQSSTDQDQRAADRDQLAAGPDWAAIDRVLANGVDRDADDRSRESRERGIEGARTAGGEPHNSASARDVAACKRDISAMARDRAAEARDLADNRWDGQIASMHPTHWRKWGQAVRRSWMRVARDRQRTTPDQARSTLYRVDTDRAQAASDRALAGRDRLLAAEDRVQAAAERQAGEVDTLTGARRRGPGLADIQHEIDRANRGDGRLIAIYVDVDGLKAVNDAKGHHAGDVMLKHIVDVTRTQLRSYEPVVRVGGDEFVCTISGTTIERARERFARIIGQLSPLQTTDRSPLVSHRSPEATRRWTSSTAPTGNSSSRARRELKIKGPEPDLRANGRGQTGAVSAPVRD